jgi:peptidoglycan/LPS O-acetylase OafA/YrhL
MAGCIVGLWTSRGAPAELVARNRTLQPLAWLILAAAFVVLRPGWSITYYGGFTLVNLAAASIVFQALHAPPAILSARPLVWIGKISYSLYLYNSAIRMAVGPLIEWPWLMLLHVGITFVCGALSHYAIERPLLRLRDRAPSRPAESRAAIE